MTVFTLRIDEVKWTTNTAGPIKCAKTFEKDKKLDAV